MLIFKKNGNVKCQKKKSCNLKSLQYCPVLNACICTFQGIGKTVTKLTDKYLYLGEIKETQMSPTTYHSQIHHEVISIRSTAYHMLRTMLDISM